MEGSGSETEKRLEVESQLPESSEIRFKYSPEFSHYWRLNCYILTKSLKLLLLFGGICILMFIVSPWVLRNFGINQGMWDSYKSSLSFLILPGLIAFIFGATYMSARKRWQRSDELRSDKEFCFSDKGVEVVGEGLRGFLDWSHFTSGEYHKGFFYLKTSQNAFHFFPVNQIPDWETFKSLVTAKISNTIF